MSLLVASCQNRSTDIKQQMHWSIWISVCARKHVLFIFNYALCTGCALLCDFGVIYMSDLQRPQDGSTSLPGHMKHIPNTQIIRLPSTRWSCIGSKSKDTGADETLLLSRTWFEVFARKVVWRPKEVWEVLQGKKCHMSLKDHHLCGHSHPHDDLSWQEIARWLLPTGSAVQTASVFLPTEGSSNCSDFNCKIYRHWQCKGKPLCACGHRYCLQYRWPHAQGG